MSSGKLNNVIWWPRNMLFFTNHETCIKTRTTLVFKIQDNCRLKGSVVWFNVGFDIGKA